jgi:hypothetical protein
VTSVPLRDPGTIDPYSIGGIIHRARVCASLGEMIRKTINFSLSDAGLRLRTT